jgi:hypothetical protein
MDVASPFDAAAALTQPADLARAAQPVNAR